MATLQQMRYFREVAELLHFGKAARSLHVAQPAISRQIQQLESELGVTLLKRTRRLVELTIEGRVYLQRVSRILEDISQAATEVRRLGTGEVGHFSIGFINSTTYGLLPKVLQGFRRLHPNVTLELREMTIIDQVKALANREIDVGLLRPPIANPDIVAQSIGKERFLLVVPSTHRFVGRKSVAISEIAGEPLIQFQQDRSPLLNAVVSAMCNNAGFVPQIVEHVNQIHTVVGLVAGGLGVGLVPETARNFQIADVQYLPLQGPPQVVELAVAWHSSLQSPLLGSFRKAAVVASE